MISNLNERVDSMKRSFLAFSKQKSFRYGIPFVMLIVGGSFVLREWTQIRYQFSRVKGVSKEEAEKMGLHRENNVTVEGIYEDIQKLDIDNWENKRGPRPWEANPELK